MIGIVGTPCQIQGLRKLQSFSRELEVGEVERVTLALGIFCMGNWSYPTFRGYLEKSGIDLRSVKKVEISGNTVRVHNGRRVVTLPLLGMKKYVKLACRLCLDFAAELADLSIGGIGSPPGWSTVIVRSSTGERLLSEAESAGRVEVQEVSEEGVSKLRRVARMKLTRNRKRLEQRFPDAPHYTSLNAGRESFSFERKGYRELFSEIVSRGLCDACGACALADSGVVMENGIPRKRGSVEKAYSACTRTFLPVRYFESSLDLGDFRDEWLGRYRRILSVRSTDKDILKRAQDGGAVTSLLAYSLSAGIISKAAVTCRGSEWEPQERIITAEEDVRKCSGTVYSTSSVLAALRSL